MPDTTNMVKCLLNMSSSVINADINHGTRFGDDYQSLLQPLM